MQITVKTWTGWAPPKPKAYNVQKTIDRIVLHYSATLENEFLDPDTIQGWHLGHGWNGIGYHYVIEPNGDVYLGRPLHVVGAHAEPNSRSIGICYVGGLKLGQGANKGFDTRTEKQKAVIDQLIHDLLEGKYNSDLVEVNPNALVCGHYQVPGTSPTQCPGFDFKTEWLEHTDDKTAAGPVSKPKPPKTTAPTHSTDVVEDKVPVPPAENVGMAGAAAAVTGGTFAAFGTVAAIVVGLIIVAGIIYLNVKGK